MALLYVDSSFLQKDNSGALKTDGWKWWNSVFETSRGQEKTNEWI